MHFAAVNRRSGRTCSPRRAGSSRGRFELSKRAMLGWFPNAGGHPSSLWGCGGVGKCFVLAHPRSPIPPPLSTLTSRAAHAHPTSPRSTGFCAIWGCISSSSGAHEQCSRGVAWASVETAVLDWTTQAIGQQHTSLLSARCEAHRREVGVICGCGNGLARDAPEASKVDGGLRAGDPRGCRPSPGGTPGPVRITGRELMTAATPRKFAACSRWRA